MLCKRLYWVFLRKIIAQDRITFSKPRAQVFERKNLIATEERFSQDSGTAVD